MQSARETTAHIEALVAFHESITSVLELSEPHRSLLGGRSIGARTGQEVAWHERVGG